MVEGMEDLTLNQNDSINLCNGCIQGKQHRQPFPKSGATRANDLLEIVHSDVCGPMKTTSLGGARYFLTFTDDKSRHTTVYFLKTKDEVLEKFKAYQALSENITGKKIKILRSDNGGEYMSGNFTKYCSNKGILQQTTAPYTPEQNGVAERLNRTVVESARCLLKQQGLGNHLWAEAIATAVYLKNRSPTKALKDFNVPEEVWTGRKPSVKHLRIFGCDAYVHVPKDQRSKLDSKSMKCIFLGYEAGSKAYRLYNPTSRNFVKSRDVIFDEEKQLSHQEIGFIPLGEEGQSQQQGNHPYLNQPEEEMETEENFEDAQEEFQEDFQETRRSEREKKLPRKYWELDNPIQVCLADTREPQSLTEALSGDSSKEWKDAIESEYASLLKNDTWTLTPLPPNRKAIGNKWIFKIKHNADGSIQRYKARLVVKGFLQTQGVDFNETFAPVVKFTSIRCLLAIGTILDLEIHQMDVKTAFLNGELEEEIYMQQPEGLEKGSSNKLVCKLNKAIYGLKQAPRAWYQKINAYLLKSGFSRTNTDHSVYILNSKESKVIISIYVDDLLLLSNNLSKLEEVKRELANAFDMKDLGQVHYLLGIQITRNRQTRTTQLSQTKYLQGILERFSMQDCKPLSTPQDVNSKLSKAMEPLTKEEVESMVKIPYQSAVGSLMYAMVATRPDIAVAVGVVSQFMNNPGQQHWTAVKRIFRYLKGSMDFCLELSGNNKLVKLEGYCDADWAGNVDNRRSTTGYTFTLAGASISWKSRHQPTVALSTTEAEYMAATEATKEAVWLRAFLDNLGYKQLNPTSILDDNQSCISLTKNPTYHARTKHIDIQHHFVREKVEANEVIFQFCGTDKMVADILTKPLSKFKHELFRRLMGIKKIH
jgi:hypothetical protein